MELVLGKRIGFVGFGDGDGEQSVGNGLGVGIGKVFWCEVLDEGGLEGLVEFAEFAFGFVFVLHEVCCGVADVFGELFGCADCMAGFVLEGFCPLLAPVVGVGGVLRPIGGGSQGFLLCSRF